MKTFENIFLILFLAINFTGCSNKHHNEGNDSNGSLNGNLISKSKITGDPSTLEEAVFDFKTSGFDQNYGSKIFSFLFDDIDSRDRGGIGNYIRPINLFCQKDSPLSLTFTCKEQERRFVTELVCANDQCDEWVAQLHNYLGSLGGHIRLSHKIYRNDQVKVSWNNCLNASLPPYMSNGMIEWILQRYMITPEIDKSELSITRIGGLWESSAKFFFNLNNYIERDLYIEKYEEMGFGVSKNPTLDDMISIFRFGKQKNNGSSFYDEKNYTSDKPIIVDRKIFISNILGDDRTCDLVIEY